MYKVRARRITSIGAASVAAASCKIESISAAAAAVESPRENLVRHVYYVLLLLLLLILVIVVCLSINTPTRAARSEIKQTYTA